MGGPHEPAQRLNPSPRPGKAPGGQQQAAGCFFPVPPPGGRVWPSRKQPGRLQCRCTGGGRVPRGPGKSAPQKRRAAFGGVRRAAEASRAGGNPQAGCLPRQGPCRAAPRRRPPASIFWQHNAARPQPIAHRPAGRVLGVEALPFLVRRAGKKQRQAQRACRCRCFLTG